MTSTRLQPRREQHIARVSERDELAVRFGEGARCGPCERTRRSIAPRNLRRDSRIPGIFPVDVPARVDSELHARANARPAARRRMHDDARLHSRLPGVVGSRHPIAGSRGGFPNESYRSRECQLTPTAHDHRTTLSVAVRSWNAAWAGAVAVAEARQRGERSASCSASQRSASIAAMQPVPAAVTA